MDQMTGPARLLNKTDHPSGRDPSEGRMSVSMKRLARLTPHLGLSPDPFADLHLRAFGPGGLISSCVSEANGPFLSGSKRKADQMVG